jgi:hypothetical protein
VALRQNRFDPRQGRFLDFPMYPPSALSIVNGFVCALCKRLYYLSSRAKQESVLGLSVRPPVAQ